MSESFYQRTLITKSFCGYSGPTRYYVANKIIDYLKENGFSNSRKLRDLRQFIHFNCLQFDVDEKFSSEKLAFEKFKTVFKNYLSNVIRNDVRYEQCLTGYVYRNFIRPKIFIFQNL